MKERERSMAVIFSVMLVSLVILYPEFGYAGILKIGNGLSALFRDAKTTLITIGEIVIPMALVGVGIAKSMGWSQANKYLWGLLMAAILVFGADLLTEDVKAVIK